MKLTELEYEIIALLKAIDDTKNHWDLEDKQEITKVKYIKCRNKEYVVYCTIHSIKFNEIGATYCYPQWEIQTSGIKYLWLKAMKNNAITKWWNYHIIYKIFYKWECYRDNGYSWKQILLGIADKKENAWQIEQINKLEQRIEINK